MTVGEVLASRICDFPAFDGGMVPLMVTALL
jgi:hypothetical protein